MKEGSTQAPVRHPVDWQNPDFYDEAKLDAELRRVFDICHGCRRCFNLCDSFPRLFDLIDNAPEEELKNVVSSDFRKVADACTLCDMCFMNKCPYVPPHAFDLDFPHLMLRYRAVEFKKGAVAFTDRELTKTDRNGSFATHIAPIANWATSTHNKLTRKALDVVAGIHPQAALPAYSSATLVDLAGTTPNNVNRAAAAFGKRKAVLYATCMMNFHDSELGMIARHVLAELGVATEVVYPSCCGMPQLEQGDLADVAAKALQVATDLQGWIRDGYDIVALVPSCALMLKQEWPLLVPQHDPAFDAVQKLADATFDLSEYIVDIATKFGMRQGMKPLAGPVALHLACHARAQNLGAKAAEMLRLLPESGAITILERCSGHGGSWGIKKDNFDIALKVGKPVARKAADVLRQAGANDKPGYIASECPLAASHIAQGVERLDKDAPATSPVAMHPLEIFAMSFGIIRGSR